jgi:hypothetical protein
MDIFPKEELKTLVKIQTPGCICVSIYMPAYKSGRPEVQQNPIRLRKLIGEARERLIKIGLKPTEADRYLEPAHGLLKDDNPLWVSMSDGFVLYLSKDYFRYYRLPVQFPELVVVANRFHVKPLLPLITADGKFYLLAMSQKTVRLLQCTRFSFNELDIAGKIPRSLDEALQYDHFDREQQFHHHYSVAGLGGAVITAHGAKVEDTKDNLLRFSFLIDRGLEHEFLHDETAPLIVLTVSNFFSIYKQANTYKYLLDKEVEGNPDKMSLFELHQQGIKAIEPLFIKRQENSLKAYNGLSE